MDAGTYMLRKIQYYFSFFVKKSCKELEAIRRKTSLAKKNFFFVCSWIFVVAIEYVYDKKRNKLYFTTTKSMKLMKYSFIPQCSFGLRKKKQNGEPNKNKCGPENAVSADAYLCFLVSFFVSFVSLSAFNTLCSV